MYTFITKKERLRIQQKMYEKYPWYVTQDHSRESGVMVIPFETKQAAIDYVSEHMGEKSFDPDSKYIWGKYGWSFQIIARENLPTDYISHLPLLLNV